MTKKYDLIVIGTGMGHLAWLQTAARPAGVKRKEVATPYPTCSSWGKQHLTGLPWTIRFNRDSREVATPGELALNSPPMRVQDTSRA